MRRLIGLHGKAGAGKSTVAQALIEDGWKEAKFAGPLKAMIRALLVEQGVSEYDAQRCVDGDHKETPLPHLSYRTPRHAMQTLGTEWGRGQMNEHLWTNAWRLKVNDLLLRQYDVVCDDVRFPNEAEAIRSMGGIVIEIVRDTRAEIATASHVSENRIEPDYTVGNNGTRTCLVEMVRSIIHG